MQLKITDLTSYHFAQLHDTFVKTGRENTSAKNDSSEVSAHRKYIGIQETKSLNDFLTTMIFNKYNNSD